MKAVVVLSTDDQSHTCRVEISIDYAVDQWWYRSKGLTCLQVTPKLPLYVAIYLKDRIAERIKSAAPYFRKHKDLNGWITTCISEIMSTVDANWQKHIDKLWNRENVAQLPEIIKHWSVESLLLDVQQVLPYIEGRRWLMEHLEKRLKMVGISLSGSGSNEIQSRDVLTTVLQYLFLTGKIELTSGITLHDQLGKLQKRCERCGSEEYGIHMHYCSFCDHDDPVCDTCYVMGVSKGCSLVISRPKQVQYQNESKKGPFLQEAAGSFYSLKRWNGEL